MQTVQCGFICLMLVLFSKTAHAALGAVCANNVDCDAQNNEVCDTSGTGNCSCDAANSYQAGPVTTTSCFQAVDLAATCTTAGVNDECLLGNGGNGTICTGATPDCQCDTGNSYEEDASTCKIDCGPLPSPMGYLLTLVGTGATATLENAEATVACATGYTEDAGTPANVACEVGGSWAGPSGCTIANCGALTDPTDGSIAYSSGTTYNSEATFSCNAGHTLTGSGTRTCGAGGDWDGSDPTCTIKDCGPLLAPTNGAVDTATGTTYGQQATYSCNTGYSLSSNAQVLCKADGTWETAPTCPVTDCGEPPNETGYTATKDGGTTYQETATVVCDTTNGWSGTAANISCEASGSWTSYSGCSGASEIRQMFSLVVLLAALVIALM